MQDFLIIDNKQILLNNGEYLKINDALEDFIEDKALLYGSSIKGRIISLSYLTGYKRKLPLIISNKYELYFLITRSLKADDCLLINYKRLLLFKKIGSKTRLYFEGNIKIDIDVDERIIKRQIKILKTYFKVIKNSYNHYDERKDEKRLDNVILGLDSCDYLFL